jgi:rubrerythrin
LETELIASAELLAEIMRDEVNHQDEAEKWLRAYAPQYLVNRKNSAIEHGAGHL